MAAAGKAEGGGGRSRLSRATGHCRGAVARPRGPSGQDYGAGML